MADFGIKYTINLAEKLKEENLFIHTEKTLLHTTYESIEKEAKELRNIAWITYQQKRNLKSLLRNDKTALTCIKYSKMLDCVRFVDGYRALTYNEIRITDFIRSLHESPDLIAYCLDSLESNSHYLLNRFVRITHDSLYAYPINRRNERLVLRCLHKLVDLQIVSAVDTRRRLRRGTGAIASLFRMYADDSFTSRLYLTEALRQPLLDIVREDEWFYDVDERRALHRFSQEHYRKRFGTVGTPAHDAAVAAYRRTCIDKLVSVTRSFVESLRNAMPTFPTGLRRLVAAFYRKLKDDDEREARAACADLVFTMYVFPAICDPGPHSILPDVPISYTANHNLMQVAQIIQNLAIGVDSKDNLYSQFEPDYISFMMDSILKPLKENESCDEGQNECYYDHIVQLTISEICDLISAVRESLPIAKENSNISDLISRLVRLTSEPNDLVELIRPSQVNKNSTLLSIPPSTPPINNKKSPQGNAKIRNSTPNYVEMERVDDVILINIERARKCPGLIPEFKIVESSCNQSNASTTSTSSEDATSRSKSDSLTIQLPDSRTTGFEDEMQQAQMKRNRNSLSNDQASNSCSENLSTLSDVAAAESDGDDFEGRRTPSNVSDVVSTMTTGDAPNQYDERRITPNLPITVRKKNLEDVTDRFGKFEIKQDLDRFEIKSTVSDTWSTDVLASDSESADQNQLERLDEVNESIIHPPIAEVSSVLADRTDTASEAWSTDVLGASDTSELQVDRLMELDQDDIVPTNRSNDENAAIMENREDTSQFTSVVNILLPVTPSDTRHSSYADSHDSEDDNKSDISSLQDNAQSPTKDGDDDTFGTLKAPVSSASDKERKDSNRQSVNLDDIKLFDPLQNPDRISDSVITRGSRPKVSFRPISDMNPTHQPIKDDINAKVITKEDTANQISSQLTESLDKHKKHHSSFFKSFKDRLTYKGTKRKTRYDKEIGEGEGTNNIDSSLLDSPNIDPSDAIFEKYRTTAKSSEDSIERRRLSNLSLPEEDMIYDATDLENCKAFKNAKNKLRVVFSTLFTPYHLSHGNEDKLPLRTILRLMLAEVTLLEDQDAITKLHETIRCLQLFNHNELGRILHSMNSDLVYRQTYNEYLLKSRRELFIHKARLQATLARVKKDRNAFDEYFLVVYVKIFLTKWDKAFSQFQSAFKNLSFSDEKIAMMDSFLSFLYKEMALDTEWKECSSNSIELSKVYMERFIMGTIYHQAMFPNQEADKDRDRILEKHISHLQTVISPRHKSLRIKSEYLFECPWPAAQDHISMLNVFRTPTDKLGCILRCTNTILNLLSLASPDKPPPAADDIMPVLIYVIIQANPPSLLSTLQYVSDFSRKLSCDFTGEASYCWTQFSSAVEYIKTID